mmetsp:Transcript_63539/g.182462  ORF Transcript_63539/g.182462 Transcript_63539/m.182462 type:complete len:159 (+) Transcript_63539:33-509(+)
MAGSFMQAPVAWENFVFGTTSEGPMSRDIDSPEEPSSPQLGRSAGSMHSDTPTWLTACLSEVSTADSLQHYEDDQVSYEPIVERHGFRQPDRRDIMSAEEVDAMFNELDLFMELLGEPKRRPPQDIEEDIEEWVAQLRWSERQAALAQEVPMSEVCAV